ncbi:MAG: diguanylate cyclase [Magnetococcus sp. DMHC-6]
MYSGTNFFFMRVFESLDYDLLEANLNRCVVMELKTGEILLSPNNQNFHLYVIIEGRLSIHLESSDTPAITMVPKGGCVGELSVFGSMTTTAFVKADILTRVLAIGKKQLWEMMNEHPRIAVNLFNILSERMRFNNDILVDSQKDRNLIYHHSRVDFVTGLYNRKWLEKSLKRLLTRFEIVNNPSSILLLQLKNFQAYLSTHGHFKTDAALISLVNCLTDVIRPDDFLARLDEYTLFVILYNTSIEGANRVSKRIEQAFSQHKVLLGDGTQLPSHLVYIGAVEMKQGDDVEGLIKRALDAVNALQDS